MCYTLVSRSAVLHPTMRTTCLKGWKSEGLAYKRRATKADCSRKALEAKHDTQDLNEPLNTNLRGGNLCTSAA